MTHKQEPLRPRENSRYTFKNWYLRHVKHTLEEIDYSDDVDEAIRKSGISGG